MDPLSIVAAVAGGISITSGITKLLDEAVSAASRIKHAPDLAVSTLDYVKTMWKTMDRLQRLLLKNPDKQRNVFLPLDDIEDVFINCVMVLDELETVLKPLCYKKSRGSAKDIRMAWTMSDRLAVAMKDKRINKLIQRVRDAQTSLNLMLSIMQQESIVEAYPDITNLDKLCKKQAPNIAHLKRRSIDSFSIRKSYIGYFEDDDASTITSTSHQSTATIQTGPPSVAFSLRFSLEATLNASRPYRRVQGHDQASASRSSTLNVRALSVLSDLSRRSLGNMSTMSFVSLPIFSNDLSNPHHYKFGELDNVIEEDEAEDRAEDEVFVPFNPPRPETPPSRTSPSMPCYPIVVPSSPTEPDTPTSMTPPRSESSRSETPFSDVPSTTQEETPTEQPDQVQPDYKEWNLCRCAREASGSGATGKSSREKYALDKLHGVQIGPEGYLKLFYCQGCNCSLADIVSQRRPGWSSFDVWCSSKACLGTKFDGQPCPISYIQRLKSSSLTDGFLGYRNRSGDEVKCIQCFLYCPTCEAERQQGRERRPRYAKSSKKETDSLNTGPRLFSTQEKFLRLQRRVFEHPAVLRTADIAELNNDVLRLQPLLKSLQEGKGASKVFLTALEHRQLALERRSNMLSAWWESDGKSDTRNSRQRVIMAHRLERSDALHDEAINRMLATGDNPSQQSSAVDYSG
ncbi:hypothetical protein BHE90_015997 [Fusarium euwallaceae]|uniref:Fungal N-terminal domain-containing protein n=1 Tax=Fusarium euwallaceae TaxID=1147111 RepID=A0A430L1J1_9HYPO|nr:hypothetical protein BHE90_015997 [Fusarium euwallaceae]